MLDSVPLGLAVGIAAMLAVVIVLSVTAIVNRVHDRREERYTGARRRGTRS